MVALPRCASEQLAPAVERFVEALGGIADDVGGQGVGAEIPGGRVGRQLAGQQRQHALDTLGRNRRYLGHRQRGANSLAQRQVLGLVGFHHLGDGCTERCIGGGQPDGLQVAAHQLFIGQVERRRADFAMHHARRVGKEELIVGAARCAIGQHQRRHAAAASAPASLGVVGRRGRHVAQVDGVQRRDVDAEFHGR